MDAQRVSRHQRLNAQHDSATRWTPGDAPARTGGPAMAQPSVVQHVLNEILSLLNPAKRISNGAVMSEILPKSIPDLLVRNVPRELVMAVVEALAVGAQRAHAAAKGHG